MHRDPSGDSEQSQQVHDISRDAGEFDRRMFAFRGFDDLEQKRDADTVDELRAGKIECQRWGMRLQQFPDTLPQRFPARFIQIAFDVDDGSAHEPLPTRLLISTRVPRASLR